MYARHWARPRVHSVRYELDTTKEAASKCGLIGGRGVDGEGRRGGDGGRVGVGALLSNLWGDDAELLESVANAAVKSVAAQVAMAPPAAHRTPSALAGGAHCSATLGSTGRVLSSPFGPPVCLKPLTSGRLSHNGGGHSGPTTQPGQRRGSRPRQTGQRPPVTATSESEGRFVRQTSGGGCTGCFFRLKFAAVFAEDLSEVAATAPPSCSRSAGHQRQPKHKSPVDPVRPVKLCLLRTPRCPSSPPSLSPRTYLARALPPRRPPPAAARKLRSPVHAARSPSRSHAMCARARRPASQRNSTIHHSP